MTLDKTVQEVVLRLWYPQQVGKLQQAIQQALQKLHLTLSALVGLIL